MKNAKVLLVMLFMCMILLIGCTQKAEEKKEAPATTSQEEGNADEEDQADQTDTEDTTEDEKVVEDTLIHFVDDDGKEINLEKPAERIISLYSAHTENIYYLGGGDQLIGNYKTATYPAEAASLPVFDYAGDPEEVIAAAPDVVLIRPFIAKKNPEFVEALEKAGIQVVSLYSESFEEFDSYIEKLGVLLGKEEKAKEKLEQFHADIEAITELTSAVDNKQTVFFESTENELRTVSDTSMPGLAITFAGGINIAQGIKAMTEGGSIAEYGVEKVLENANEIDVYVSQSGSMNSGGDVETISNRPGFDTIKAVKEGRVYVIDEKIISSPSFRYLDGIKELARYMYPELMEKLN